MIYTIIIDIYIYMIIFCNDSNNDSILAAIIKYSFSKTVLFHSGVHDFLSHVLLTRFTEPVLSYLLCNRPEIQLESG